MNPNQADPEAMSAYTAEMQAAYARLLQRCAPQHAYAPVSSMPLHQQQHAMPMHFPVPPTVHAPQGGSNPPRSKRPPASDPGSSLWTIFIVLLVGLVGGFYGGRESRQLQSSTESCGGAAERNAQSTQVSR